MGFLRISCYFFLSTCVVLSPVREGQVFAWGDNGHIAVAKVADLYLTDGARNKARQLLGADIYARKICMFADAFKHTPDGSFTRAWHFADVPDGVNDYDPARDCQQGNCVVAAIVEQKRVFKDAGATTEQRLMALKFLIHFVGDIHQPLHCSQRNGDHGGNEVHVRFLGRNGHLNLHSVWDDTILGENLQAEDPEDYAVEIKAKITSQQKSAWEQEKDPVKWVLEGHRLAHDVAYDGISISNQSHNLDATYVNRAKPVVEMQIQKAGVRLAKLLNELLH